MGGATNKMAASLAKLGENRVSMFIQRHDPYAGNVPEHLAVEPIVESHHPS